MATKVRKSIVGLDIRVAKIEAKLGMEVFDEFSPFKGPTLQEALDEFRARWYDDHHKCDYPPHTLAIFRQNLSRVRWPFPDENDVIHSLRMFLPNPLEQVKITSDDGRELSKQRWLCTVHAVYEATRNPEASDATQRKQNFLKIWDAILQSQSHLRSRLNQNVPDFEALAKAVKLYAAFRQAMLPGLKR